MKEQYVIAIDRPREVSITGEILCCLLLLKPEPPQHPDKPDSEAKTASDQSQDIGAVQSFNARLAQAGKERYKSQQKQQ